MGAGFGEPPNGRERAAPYGGRNRPSRASPHRSYRGRRTRRGASTRPGRPGEGLSTVYGRAIDYFDTGWSIPGVGDSGGCTYSGSASWAAGESGLEAALDPARLRHGRPAYVACPRPVQPLPGRLGPLRLSRRPLGRPVLAARARLRLAGAPVGPRDPGHDRHGDAGRRQRDHQARVGPQPEGRRALALATKPVLEADFAEQRAAGEMMRMWTSTRTHG